MFPQAGDSCCIIVSLTALRLATTSLFLPITTAEIELLQSRAHQTAPSLTLSGWLLRVVPTDSLGPRSDPVTFDVTLRVPFGCGRDDVARVFRSSLIRCPGGRSTVVRCRPTDAARPVDA